MTLISQADQTRGGMLILAPVLSYNRLGKFHELQLLGFLSYLWL
jgi:hypothetical protein